jgi:fructoselysine-6-P-deglycase FrlB-like protein
VLVLGCGTSWFVARCIAESRESAGLGETDAVCASEYVPPRPVPQLRHLFVVPGGTHRVAVTAVAGQPVDTLAETRLLLDFADERSVVQTRFPTTVLALARAAFGEDLSHLAAHARAALVAPLPADPGGAAALHRHHDLQRVAG